MNEKYKSLEELEFSLLKEIPQDSLKNPTITEQLMEDIAINLKDLENVGVQLDERLGVIDGKSVYYRLIKTRYGRVFDPKFILTDITNKEFVLNLNDEEYEYNDLFTNPQIKSICEEFYARRNDIVKHVCGERYKTMSLSGYDVIRLISQCKNVDEFKQKYELAFKKSEEELIYEEMGSKIKREDLETEKERLRQEQIDIYNRGEGTEFERGWFKGVILGNTITCKQHKFVFEKKVCEVLPYEFWYNIDTSYGDLHYLSSFLNSKAINYSYYDMKKEELKEEFNEWKLVYKIAFIGNEIFVDNERVPRAKLVFFLKRANGTTERIKKLKKLNGRCIQIMEQKELWLRDNELIIDFKALTDDGKTFDLELLGGKYKTTYEELIPLFFYGRDIHISAPNSIDIYHFLNKLGVTKTQFFDYLRKVKMLKELNETD